MNVLHIIHERIAMSKRIVTSIRVNKELLHKAKEIGLNISKVSENALKDMINRIEGSKATINPENRLENDVWWGRPDLNRSPESPSLRAWTKLADGPSFSTK